MGEDFDLEDLLEIDSQFDRFNWKKKEMITKKRYMIETKAVCESLFNQYKSTEDGATKYKMFGMFETHTDFEKYLTAHSDELDKFLEVYGDDDVSDYFYTVDARLGIKSDKKNIFDSVFFRIKEGECDIYYSLPRVMFNKYDTKFKEEDRKEKDNETMYI
jgi:hypothetical protein